MDSFPTPLSNTCDPRASFKKNYKGHRRKSAAAPTKTSLLFTASVWAQSKVRRSDSCDTLEQACPNKNHPDLQKPPLACEKNPLSSYSWQSRFSEGQAMNNHSQKKAERTRYNSLVFVTHSTAESAKTSCRTTPTSLFQAQRQMIMSHFNSPRL